MAQNDQSAIRHHHQIIRITLFGMSIEIDGTPHRHNTVLCALATD